MKLPGPAVEVKESKDVGTQTTRQKLRRKGGWGSRTRRMLAFQLMLTVKRGLPMSRLLSHQVINSRSLKEESLKVKEEIASTRLMPERVKVEVEKKQEQGVSHKVKEEKEEESCPREGVSAGGFPIFTPRSSQTGGAVPTPDSFPLPTMTPSYLPPPSYVWIPVQPFTAFYTPPPCGLMPGQQWICGACGAVSS